MKKQSVSKAAIVATAIFALATGSAWAANNYWAAPDGTGNFTDANWLDPANGTMSTYAYAENLASGGIFFTNYTDNVVNLGGQSLKAYAIRTPTATKANPARIKFSNGTLSVDVSRQAATDVLNAAEVMFGDGFTFRHTGGQYGIQLVKNAHFILEPGSTFVEVNSDQTKMRSQIGFGSSAAAGSSNSLYIASGATATFRRTLQLGTSNNSTSCATGIVHVAGGTFNGYAVWLGYHGGESSSSGRGAFIVDNGGTANLSYSGGFSMTIGTQWVNNGVYNGVSEVKVGPGSTFVAQGGVQFREYGTKIIDIDGGTFTIKGTFAAWENDSNYKAQKATVNVHGGGVLEVGGLAFNTFSNNGYNFIVDGGTLRAFKSFTTLSNQGNTGKTLVTVGDNGFDFDTQSYDVTWRQGIEGGTGTLRKLGSGSLAFSIVPTFNGTIDVAEGTFKLVDGSVLNFPGTITVRDGAVFEKTSRSSNPATKNSSFVFEAGATVKPYINAGTPIAIEAASFTFPAEGVVTVDLGSYAPQSGTCEILKLTGDSTFSQTDLAGISVANATLSTDGKSVFASFGSNPSYVWIGGSGNFSDAANWAGGAVPPAATAIDITIFDNGANVYVTNDITGLTPKSISLVGDAVVRLRGKKMTGLERVNNNFTTAATYRDYIMAPIEFAGTMTIGGNVWIQFSDAKAETIAFDSAASLTAQQGLLGYITLTGDWTPDRALSIEDGTLTVEGTLGGWGKLAIKASGSLKTGSISYTSATENAVAFTEISGLLEVDSISVVNSEDMFISSNGVGTIKTRQITADTKENVRLNANVSDLTWIIGEGGITYGSTATAYSGANGNCIYLIGTGKSATMKPMADWSWEGSPIDGELFLSGSSKGSLILDTTDAYDSSRARTVTLNGFVRQGVNMTVKGIGTVVLNHAEPFQFGTLNSVVSVEDAATLRLNPVCTTLAAAVTMANGTALALPLDSNGEVVTHSVSNFTQAVNAGVRFVVDGDTLADGEYTLITATHSISADPSKILIVGTAVAGKVATALVDGNNLKMTVSSEYTGPDSIWTGVKDSNLLDPDNWLGGVPTAENGRAAVIGVAEPATFVCPAGFSPVSITFPAGSAKVTIEGEGEISGIAAITNLSNASHEFKVPVSGGTVDLVNVSMYCTFTGGFTVENPVFANSVERNLARGIAGNWTVTGEGFVTLPYMKIYSGIFHVTAPMGSDALANLLVAEGATFRAAIATLPANGYVNVDENYIRIGYRNGGTVIFDELVAESATEMKKLAFSQESTGIIRIGKFTNNAKQNVRLNDLTFIMGEGGLCYGPDSSNGTTDWYSTAVGAGTDATIWPSADYTIGLNGNDSRDPKSSSNTRRDFGLGYTSNGADSSVLTLYTSDYDDNSVPRKVTIDGVIYSNVSAGYGLAGKMRVCGCGEVLFNSYSRFGMGITVEDTATLSVNAGCAPGKGNVTMNSGTTLSLPETGSVTLGGTLTLGAGTKLGFTIDGADNSVLTVPSLTLNATAVDPVKVTINAVSEMTPGKAYTLLSGGGLAARDVEKFKLPDGDVGALSVSNGNLVYTAPEYFYIRIAESGIDELTVPFSWLYESGIATSSSTAADIEDALAADGENGIPAWQSYCLGLDPQNAQSVVLCDVAETKPSDGTINFTARNLNVPQDLSGVEVMAYLDTRTAEGEWNNGVASASVTSGSAVLTSPALGNGISFFA